MTPTRTSPQPTVPSGARRLCRGLLGIPLALAVTATGVLGATAAADQTPVVSSSDSAALSSQVLTAGGGKVTAAPSRTGTGGAAMRFPAFAPAASGPRAVVEARSAGTVDVLDPGTADFTFGADILLDEQSHQHGTSDNGNNVLQRGLFDSTTQYKIQIDSGKASCRVKGASGAVMVVSKATIVPGEWFGLACSRIGATVSLAVTSWDGATARTQVVSEGGATGDLTPSDRSIPLAIGAKVHDAGTFTDSPDQFNGVIDNPYLRVGDRLITVAMPAEPVARIATTSHLSVSDPTADLRSRVRFTGTVAPGGASAGSTVVFKLKKKSGVKKKLGRQTLSATGSFRFDDVKVKKGRYRVVFPRQGALLKSTATLVYRRGAFRTP